MTLDELSLKYHRILGRREIYFECHGGWADVLDAYFAVIDQNVRSEGGYEVRQLKEKYGGLRIYDRIADVSAAALKAIDDARELVEARSYYVCEMCGAPGALRGGEWWRVRCDEHARDEDTGEVEPPRQPGPDIRIGSATSTEWRRYDPDIDAFVECEPPESMR